LTENSVQLEPRQRDDVLIDLSGPISGKNNIADRGLLGIFLNERASTDEACRKEMLTEDNLLIQIDSLPPPFLQLPPQRRPVFFIQLPLLLLFPLHQIAKDWLIFGKGAELILRRFSESMNTAKSTSRLNSAAP
jgi:hypothetical protein